VYVSRLVVVNILESIYHEIEFSDQILDLVNVSESQQAGFQVK
jgi:hypothetical protein